MITSNLDLLIPGNDTDLPGSKLRTKWATVKETSPQLALTFDFYRPSDSVVVDGLAPLGSTGTEGKADPLLADAGVTGLVFPSWSLVDENTLHSGQLVWVIIDGREVGIIGAEGGTFRPLIQGFVSGSSLTYGQWIEPETTFPPYLLRGGFTHDGSKIVIPQAGFYRVTSNVRFRDGVGAIPRGVSYFFNGKKDSTPEMMRYDGWNGWELAFDGPNVVYFFNKGDTISLACYTANSGGGTVYNSWITVELVSR